MFSETYTLDRYKDDRKLVWVVAALFFSFSLAVYYFCPNARKKGKWFLLTGAGGALMYGLAQVWLPPPQEPAQVQAEYALTMFKQACVQRDGDVAATKDWAKMQQGQALNAAQTSLWTDAPDAVAWQWDELKNRYVLLRDAKSCRVFMYRARGDVLRQMMQDDPTIEIAPKSPPSEGAQRENVYVVRHDGQARSFRVMTNAETQALFQAALTLTISPDEKTNASSTSQSDQP